MLSQRERTAEGRKANEAALILSTLELVEEGTPFAGLSIEQIVRRAGLSRPTFYAYFDDKRELVLRLGQDLLVAVDVAAGPWLAGAETPVRDTLQGVLAAFRHHGAAVRAVIEATTYDEEVARFWRAFHEHFALAARQRIAEGHPQLDQAAVAARSYALVWMTERSLVDHVSDSTVDEEALLDELAWFWASATSRG